IPSCRAALDDEITDAIASLEPELDGVYEAIGDASPDARVVTTQYMPLMPDEGESCAFTEALPEDDVDWAREKTEQLNAAVDAAYRSAVAPAVERGPPFLGEPDTAPMHPTALGQEAMAGAIGAAL